jgi:DNA excision repair protein ERCC-2
MREGSQIHADLQSAHGPGWSTEVSVKSAFRWSVDPYEPLELEIYGRVDGIYRIDDHAIIEEIKTTRAETVEQGRADHWAQAKCYGALLATTEGIDKLTVRLVYVHSPTGAQVPIEREYDGETLITFLYELLDEFGPWAAGELSHRARRNSSIASVKFPFAEYRRGQESIVEATSALSASDASGTPLFIHAPTGIGKTIAVLYAATKALAEGHYNRLFYFAAKGTGKQAAYDAADRLLDAGADFRVLVITAKEKICLRPPEAVGPSGECMLDRCPYAIGYLDRVREALFEGRTIRRLDAEAIVRLAKSHRLCPFELSLDLSMVADMVICDYNYLFDPRVYLRRHFAARGRYLFLIDEAHNLPDRARDMYSASLNKKVVLRGRRALSNSGGEGNAKKALGRLNKWFLEAAKALEGSRHSVQRSIPPDLLARVEETAALLEELLGPPREQPGEAHLVEAYYQCRDLARAAGLFDEGYRFYLEPITGGDMRARIFCVDPARAVQASLSKGTAAVFFSGTLVPVTYFTSLLTTADSPPTLVLPSPFPEDNRRVLAYSGIDTRYRARSRSYGPIAELVDSVVHTSDGNYLVYFPAYTYLSRVHGEYWLRRPKKRIQIQHRGMDDDARAEFLDGFARSSSDPSGIAAFAVLGGVFAEGVDLYGNLLDGAVIAGVGLPPVSLEREIIREHFEVERGHGFLYAYVYPGMNRIIQAAGRVIRSPSDRGVIILVGRRFAQNPYRDIWTTVWPDGAIYDELSTLLEDLDSFRHGGTRPR